MRTLQRCASHACYEDHQYYKFRGVVQLWEASLLCHFLDFSSFFAVRIGIMRVLEAGASVACDEEQRDYELRVVEPSAVRNMSSDHQLLKRWDPDVAIYFSITAGCKKPAAFLIWELCRQIPPLSEFRFLQSTLVECRCRVSFLCNFMLECLRSHEWTEVMQDASGTPTREYRRSHSEKATLFSRFQDRSCHGLLSLLSLALHS